MKLVGGSKSTEGRVEVCMDSTWSIVCGYWNSMDSQVVCRQLGYPGGEWIT